MKIGASVEVVRGEAPAEWFLEKCMQDALQHSAEQIRDILKEETKGPKSGMVSTAADFWEIEETTAGPEVFNKDPLAGYLEFGVGIYNEGEGSKEPIRPKNGKFLHWEGVDGHHFAKEVKGYRGTAMVRNNMERFEQLLEANASKVFDAAIERRPYAK